MGRDAVNMTISRLTSTAALPVIDDVAGVMKPILAPIIATPIGAIIISVGIIALIVYLSTKHVPQLIAAIILGLIVLVLIRILVGI
jgi:hypothetical protein